MAEFLRPSCTQPDLFEAATEVSRSQPWLTARYGTPRLISLGIHGALLALALIPWAVRLPVRPKMSETTVTLYTPADIRAKRLLLPSRSKSGGGSGGGKQQPRPPSLGVLPRAADKQLAPPDPEPPKNPDPALIVEPTIVAPQLAHLRPLDLLRIGDPQGIAGPPSSGPGTGGGIGTGDGRGLGKGDEPGAIDGSGGGCCDGVYRIGGGVTAPTILYRVEPQYSEEARKARYQGTVVLEPLCERTAGSTWFSWCAVSVSGWMKTQSRR